MEMQARQLIFTTFDCHDPDIPLPPHLLPAFMDHLRKYPDDTNFILTPFHGHGFGVVACFEDPCLEVEDPWNARIYLDQGSWGPADTLSGFGCLQAFHDHIDSSAAHRDARTARVAQAVLDAQLVDEQPKIGD